jgi:hypothetical protein
VHRSTFRRARRSLALGVAMAAALAVVGPLAQAGAAGGKDESFATLRVTAESVSVKAKGADDFKKAKDGDELHAGDTVRTDATGKAEIEYGDDAYTRLDVDTTFKITKLTDDEGNRQVEGTIESGKTWNRTAALTESESFQQTGADATAAVEGTAFAIECETVDHCVFTGVVDDVSLTGADGVKKLLNPLDECDSTSGILCGDITQISADDLPAWILDNLILDITEGFEFPFGGTIVVEGAQVFFVPDDPPTPPPPPVIPDPIVDPNPVDITSLGSDPTPGENTDPGDEVVSQDERSDVTFMLQVTDSSGGDTWIEFTELPPETFGRILDGSLNVVVVGNAYEFDEVFTFDPVEIEPVCDDGSPTAFEECFTNGNPSEGPDASSGTVPYPSIVTEGPVTGSVQWSDTFTFQAFNDLGGESAPVSVTLTVVDDICTGGEGTSRPAVAVVTCPSL